MSVFFVDSFDHYTALGLKYDSIFNVLGGTPMLIQAGSAANGLAGFRYQPGFWDCAGAGLGFGPNAAIYKAFQTNLATATVGLRLRPTLYTSSLNTFYKSHGQFFAFTDGPSRQISLHLVPGGQVAIINGDGTVLATTTRQLALNIFRFIEFKVTFSATGAWELRFDGINVSSGSGITKKTGNLDSANAAAFGTYSTPGGPGNNTQMSQWDMDDLYLADTAGTVNNDFVGDMAMKMDLPAADDTPLQFSRGGTDTGANFSQVNENPPNGDTTENHSSTVGNIDHFGFPTLVANVIKVASVTMVARKTDGSSRSIRASVKSGATTGASAADLALSTNYFMYQGMFEVDPNTSAAWTVANFNAAKKGYKVAV